MDRILPIELDRVAERLRHLLGEPPQTAARYAIGSLVHEVKHGAAIYGSGAVKRLAASTGEDVASLYRCAAVASRWPLAKVEALLAHRPARLSWSHLVLIAGVDCPEERDCWIERCRAERLSVRTLDEMLAAHQAAAEEPGMHLRAQRALRAAERLLDAAAKLSDAMSGETWPCDMVERAIAAHERMRCLAERELHRLRRHRGSDPVTGVSGAILNVENGRTATRSRQ